MNWSAQITQKSEVTPEGQLTYTYVIVKDDEVTNITDSVTGNPTDIQQLIGDKVKAYAQSYELADDLPNVGEVLSIITTE